MKLNVKLENLKIEVKTLKPIHTNQSYTKCLIQESNEASHSCKCCNKFKEEIIDLKNALAKFTLGKNNLDIILGKQRCVLDKAGFEIEVLNGFCLVGNSLIIFDKIDVFHYSMYLCLVTQ